MPVQIPFPIPSHGYALNSKMRINLEFLVDQFNEFNTGSATWDTVAIGTPNNLTGTLTFWNSSNAHYLTFKAGATAVDTTYTWPTALPLTSSHHLLTGTNAGIMSWDTNEWLVTADQPGVLITGIAGAGTIINIHNTLGAEGFVRMDNDTTNPKFVTLLGTSNQVVVTHNSTNTTLSLPQSIDTGATVTFGLLTVGNGSLGTEALRLGSGPTQIGIFNNSGVMSFSTGGTLRATIDGGGNVLAVGNFLGQGIRLEETGAGTDYIEIVAPSSIAASYTLTLPIDDGNSGEVLSTNGSGVLSWVAQSSGASTALSNLAAVAINTSLLAASDNSIDLGSSTKNWRSLYVSTSIKNGSTTLATATELGYLTGVTSAIQTQLAAKATDSLVVHLAGSEAITGAKTFSATLTMSGATIAMGANKITGLASGTASTDAVAFTQIKYIQAPIQGTTATSTSTSSSTYQNTNLAATITPTSSSNRIKITVTGGLQVVAAATSTEAVITVKRGTTDICPTVEGFNRLRGQALTMRAPAAFSYIDSPATTSATTYTVCLRNNDNTNAVTFPSASTETCVIILEEVV